MDWSNESYVRLYVRDTTTWHKLRWQGQALLMFLLRKVDRSGMLENVTEPNEDLSLMTGLPLEIVEAGLKRLKKEKVVTICDSTLLMPNFLEAQEASKSDKQRQKESRATRRHIAMLQESESQKVTKSHTQSQAVTSGHSLPCSTLPCPAMPNTPKPPKGFNEFWEVYPKKTAKKTAEKAWKKATDKPSIEAVIAAVEAQKKSKKWQEGFIPNPATWINGGCWGDEITQGAIPIRAGKELQVLEDV